ncbi:MAG: fasciclin domain-containing protein [Flavobacteriales bacterium]|nr:fasciclin domain-containing protein [Flavobacteriales bacterium]
MKRTPLYAPVAAFLTILLLAACGGAAEPVAATGSGAGEPGPGQSAVVDEKSVPNVVGIAVNSPDHKTLVAAVLHVKYQDVLANAGPFTVYAPTDAAFAALPAGTLDELLKPENKEKLQDILEYHVAVGVFQPDKMTNGRKLNMANLKDTKFTVGEDGSVMVNDAKVLGTAPASNGLVVVIDKVLLPPTE